MKEKRLRIVTILAILFLLDLIRPFHYSLHTEFLFIGLILLFLDYPPSLSLPLAIIFGYLKDALSEGTTPLYLIEFFLLFLLIRYALLRLRQRAIRIFIGAASTIIHIILNSVKIRQFFPLVCLYFFIHTFLLFLLADYLLKRTDKKSLPTLQSSKLNLEF